MNRLLEALIRLDTDLRELDVPWALIGGLAVSIRSEPRTTQDIDVALATGAQGEAATIRLIRDLLARGYRRDPEMDDRENSSEQLAMVRLISPSRDREGVKIDLLSAFSGIEAEVVAGAGLYEVLPGFFMPIAAVGDLIALKIEAGRVHDWGDARQLLKVADDRDLARARATVDQLLRRGSRKNLQERLSALLAGAPSQPGGYDG